MKTALQSGMAKPVTRPKATVNKERRKEDGALKSQRILLTWLIEDENIFRQIAGVIGPEDFTEPLYHTVAELLYRQQEEGTMNPAQIMNRFTDEEEHRRVAELFHTRLPEISTAQEKEKALKETVVRIKQNSLDEASKSLDATDMKGLQRLMEGKRALQDMKELHISIN